MKIIHDNWLGKQEISIAEAIVHKIERESDLTEGQLEGLRAKLDATVEMLAKIIEAAKPTASELENILGYHYEVKED